MDEMSIVSRGRRAAKGSIYYVPKVRARRDPLRSELL